MVVGDDQVDAELAGQRGRVVRGRAAVGGHDDVRAGRGELGHDGWTQAVPVHEAIRQADAWLDADHAQPVASTAAELTPSAS